MSNTHERNVETRKTILVKTAQLLGVVLAVIGLGLVSNPSNYVQWFNGLGANQVAWIGLGTIAVGLYIIAKKGH